MNRWGPGVALTLIFAHGSLAGGVATTSLTAKTRVDGRCAAHGEGFLAVAGSDACAGISGHISAGPGFGAGVAHGGSPSVSFGRNPLVGADAAASGDLRFDAPNGPARVYLNVGNSTISRWQIDSQ